MKRLIVSALCLFLITSVLGQSSLSTLRYGGPLPMPDIFINSILNGTDTFTNKTLISPTITAPTITGAGSIIVASETINGTLTLANDETIKNSADGDVIFTADDDAATLLQVYYTSSIDTPNIEDNDLMELVVRFNDDNSALVNWGIIQVKATDVTTNSKDSDILFKNYASDSQVTPLTLSGADATFAGSVSIATAVNPDASDGAALGTTSLEWSDLYIADAGVINFGDDQDVTLTHVADTGLLLNTQLEVTGAIKTGYGNGAVAQNPAATVVEYGDGAIHKTVITLAADSLTINGATGVGFGGQKFYDFPEGRILVLGVTCNLTFDLTACNLDGADGGDFAIGTVVVADADLGDATDVDLLPSTSVDPLSGGFSGALAASAQFDGTGTAKDLCLNGLIDDADIGADGEDILVSGTITVSWVNLGDY